MRWRSASVVVVVALAGAGCGGGGGTEQPVAPQPPEAHATPTPTPTQTCNPAVAVADLPLDTRLRQLLFAGVWTGGDDPIAEATAAAAAGVGGINFLGNDSQVYANGELAGVAAAGGAIPPFLAVDEEGGRVQRLKAITGSDPSARAMGQTMTPEQVQQLAAQVGLDMAGLGLDMDLAPVADVSSQPAHSVIGDRSFSGDPAAVTQFAGAYAAGLQAQGVVPVLKHFPGLGSASGNTDSVPAITPPLAELQQSDLVPYETLVHQQPIAVMMANASVPDLTDGAPASLSPAAVRLLRVDYGFDGLVMTDSLSAGAITSAHALPEAVELAIGAGVDMALWDTSAELDQLVAQLTDAVTSGRLSQDQINESVHRILELKKVDACVLTGQAVTAP